MLKKILTTSLVAATLIFSACGGGSSEGESQLETQQMLDNGNYDAVIAKLEATASSSSDYLALAAAYMGKAGFSLSSIVGIVATSADSNEDSTFASFIENAQLSSNTQSLNDLKTAVDYYQNVVQNRCLDVNATLTGGEADLCLYVGLSKVSQTAVAIGYIADDVNVLNDNNGSDDKLTASLCAMQYAVNPVNVDPTKCTVSNQDRNITFVDSNRTYEEATFTVNGTAFNNLITYNTPRSTAITNGICTLASFATRVADVNASGYDNSLTYHACPVNESRTNLDITTENILVDALNDGTDSIGVAVSADVKSDIDQFKQDIIDSRTNGDTNTTITIEDIIKYLEDNNK